ncbi:MAG: hypothetical protein WC459_03560 [Patescibacteria group bacterium]
MNKDNLEELKVLSKDLGLNTLKSLVNTALSLFAWAVEERKQGRIIVSLDTKENTIKELHIPCLLNIKPD